MKKNAWIVLAGLFGAIFVIGVLDGDGHLLLELTLVYIIYIIACRIIEACKGDNNGR